MGLLVISTASTMLKWSPSLQTLQAGDDSCRLVIQLKRGCQRAVYFMSNVRDI